MRLILGIVMAIWGTASALAAEEPLLARSALRGGVDAGSVFFLKADVPQGAVAVGVAHHFDPSLLAESVEVDFLTPAGVSVGRSSRYYTRPGRPFRATGSSMRDDHVVFALEADAVGLRLLEAADELPAVGSRVEIVGLGVAAEREERIAGTVVRAEPRRIEVELDHSRSLKGWGGAPLLDPKSGRVYGLLQAAWPAEGKLRTGAGPIGGVVDAIAEPLDEGLGRLFASMAPPASAANSPAARRRAATGSPFGDATERTARVITEALRLEKAPQVAGEEKLEVNIEYPPAGQVIGDASNTFIAGRALSRRNDTTRFDLVIVVDTSASTLGPSGADIDGDGTVGVFSQGVNDGEAPKSSDPGDSILAAELSAAAKLIEGLDPRRTRVSLVTFSGMALAKDRFFRLPVEVKRAAFTLEPLTSDYDRIVRAFSAIQERDAMGQSHLAAGVDQATLELLGLEGALSSADPFSQKIVLFFTDGQPTLPQPLADGVNVRAVLDAAQRARRSGVRIHSFAIGPEALAGPASTVEMAAITDGVFTPVRHPGDLTRFVETTNFAEIAQVEVFNRSTGKQAHQVRVHADGSWDGLVPLQKGENRLEIVVRSASGGTHTEALTVESKGEAKSPPLPAELVAKRGQLLRGRLEQLEIEKIAALRKELVIQIDKEREAAEERAARQLKILEIEVQRD